MCTQPCLPVQISKLTSKIVYSIALSYPILGLPNHYSSASLRQAYAIVSLYLKQTFILTFHPAGILPSPLVDHMPS